MRTENKGKKHFVGGSPVGQGLPERVGLFKKGLSTGRFVFLVKTKQITICFGNDNYWSSTESSDNNAFNVNSDNGNVNNNNKNNTYRVRCALAF